MNSYANSVAIIGGGVAGMSCALWLVGLSYQPIIIEHNERLGGQLQAIKRDNRWVLGFPNTSSTDLAQIYANHIANTSVTVCFRSHLNAVVAANDGYLLTIATDKGSPCDLAVKALVIATGARAQGSELLANIPGFSDTYAAGLISFFPLDHIEKLADLSGKTVAVIGGGDNAHFTALDLAEADATVHLLIRSTPKARTVLREKIAKLTAEKRIVEHHATVISAFSKQTEGLAIELSSNGLPKKSLLVEQVFGRLGFAANTDFLDEFSAFSNLAKRNGFIITDTGKRTNLPWVYAIGDVSHSRQQSVVAALADGALAAQDFSERM